jgi:glycosyltransferase involved in cell wall biosynthesis/ADP-heptose:LPS heptosyltransferase
MPLVAKPVGIVIPWFGRDLLGGAERHAWELATRLARRGYRIEVITTCCRSHQDDWSENHLSAGLTEEPEGFGIRRFPVLRRDRKNFDRVFLKLFSPELGRRRPGVSPVSPEDEAVFAEELIRCPALLEHLRSRADDYAAFLFLPYLYVTTLRGLPLVAEKSILIPCLHDEVYAFLPLVAAVFAQARRVLFLSEGEARLATRIFGFGGWSRSGVAGAGVEVPSLAASDQRVDLGVLGRFVLCLGRQGTGKNTDLVARAYAAYRVGNANTRLNLVLAGPGEAPLPADRTGILNLGTVSETDKHRLLAGCAALFNPSINESYSRVLMEAWQHARPVVVHADCLATATAVQDSGGGWVAGSEGSWLDAFARIDRQPPGELDALGAAGRIYTREYGEWDRAISRYEAAIRDLVGPSKSDPGTAQGTIHQVLPNISYGDAISNEAFWIKRVLLQAGYVSEIYALDIDPRVRSEVQPWQAGKIPATAGLLYHHAIGSAITEEACAHPGPKALIYHNITPHRFFEPYLPYHTRLCLEGREQLPQLARFFPDSVGDSAFNAAELAEVGFRDPGVLPLAVDPDRLNQTPDPDLMRELQDGRTKILFVGRLAPNKRQEDLIIAFAHYRKLDPTAVLHLVGKPAVPDDPYRACLERLVQKLDLSGAVRFTGMIDDAGLAAYFRTARLIWSMSEHEGFCVPLIEAMWFDVPVLAFAAGAVPETLDGAGVLFRSKADPEELARIAYQLVHDPVRRETVLAAQRRRREAFLPAQVEPQLLRLVRRIDHRLADAPSVPAASSPPVTEVREIAVIKLDHVGDLLLASPAFYSLRQRFPEARITAVVAPASADILRRNPYIDRIVPFDPPWHRREVSDPCFVRDEAARNSRSLRELLDGRFDLVVHLYSRYHDASLQIASLLPHRFLLSHQKASSHDHLVTHPVAWPPDQQVCHKHQGLLRSVGADAWSGPVVYYSAEDSARAVAVGQPDRNTVVLAPGASLPLERWASVKFRELARRLRQRGYRVAVVGSAPDRRLIADWDPGLAVHDLCGRLDVIELAAYLSRVGCLVASDSAQIHIGAAVGIPVVYLMRPPEQREFAPVSSISHACTEEYCPDPCHGSDPEDPAAAPVFCRCIQSVTVDQVEAKVLRGLNNWDAGDARRLLAPLGTGPFLQQPAAPVAPSKPRVAFVVQRAGREVNGGSEALCLQRATRMAAHWQVEILTTCALDYVTWANHYPPGTEAVGEVVIRRFPVEQPRDPQSFAQLCDRFHPTLATTSIAEGEAWMKEQGPWCPALFEYLAASHLSYERFIFFTYLYCTSYFGLPLVADRAVLVPTAHDEWPIYFPMWDRWFAKPRAFIFNTIEEKAFTQQRFPALAIDGPVAGIPVTAPTDLDAARFRRRFQLDKPFLLYLGRIDPIKGCLQLCDYFMRLRETESAPRKLVLLGKAVMEIPAHPDIIAPGFVSEQEKWDALAACEFVVMPSLFESLSLVLLEAWAARRAALVNGNSAVLAGQCRRSGGGLAYRDETEFRAAVRLLDDPARRQTMGESGQRFVDGHYRPEIIDEIYLRAGTATVAKNVPPALVEG